MDENVSRLQEVEDYGPVWSIVIKQNMPSLLEQEVVPHLDLNKLSVRQTPMQMLRLLTDHAALLNFL